MSVSGLSNLAIVQMGKTVDSTYYIENIRKKVAQGQMEKLN